MPIIAKLNKNNPSIKHGKPLVLETIFLKNHRTIQHLETSLNPINLTPLHPLSVSKISDLKALPAILLSLSLDYQYTLGCHSSPSSRLSNQRTTT